MQTAVVDRENEVYNDARWKYFYDWNKYDIKDRLKFENKICYFAKCDVNTTHFHCPYCDILVQATDPLRIQNHIRTQHLIHAQKAITRKLQNLHAHFKDCKVDFEKLSKDETT